MAAAVKLLPCLCLLTLLPVPAAAVQLGPLTIGGDASLASDYRFRGVSLSGGDPVVSAGLSLDGPGGLFAGAVATSRSNYLGGNGEIDAYGGWRGGVGPVTATAGVFHRAFPDASRADFTEVFGSVARSLGPAQVTVGINYAPEQANLARDNVYAYAAASVGVPRTPLTINAAIGYDEGGVARNLGLRGATVDWSLGAEARFGTLFVGARYIGNDARGAGRFGDTVVVSAGVRF